MLKGFAPGYILEYEANVRENGNLVKEMTIIHGDWILHKVLPLPPIQFLQLSKKDRDTNHYLERYYHRLGWSAGTCKDSFQTVVTDAIPRHSLIYIKGSQKLEWIRSLFGGRYTYIQLEHVLPSLKTLETINVQCPYQSHGVHCSYLKAMFISNTIFNI